MAIDKDLRDLEQIDFDIKDMVNILDQVEIKEKRAPLPNKRNLILDEIKTLLNVVIRIGWRIYSKKIKILI